MESACSEIIAIETNENLRAGLRILARIIARDFMSRQAANDGSKFEGEDNDHVQE